MTRLAILGRGCLRILLVTAAVLLVALALVRGAAWWRERDGRVPAATRLYATPLGRVAVAETGAIAATPVMIVPGTAGWSGFWRGVAAHLARHGYRVIAIDLPPFGYSDRDPLARYDRASQAARLSAVLAQAAHGRRAVVVGHSFGAGAATELALRHPTQVARLVLVDAALGRIDPPAGRKGMAGRMLAAPLLGQPLVAATLTNPQATGALVRSMLARKQAAAVWLPVIRRPMRRPGTTAGYAAWAPALFATDDGGWSRHSGRLAAIRVPVALIWGEADTVTPVAQGEALARLVHARSFVKLAGVGHIPHIEDPVHFLPALDAAIAEPSR